MPRKPGRRGKQPRWLAELTAAGKKVEDFLIKKDGGAKPAKKATAKKATRKTATKRATKKAKAA